MTKQLLLLISLFFLSHCSTMVDTNQRRFLDSTFHSETRPGWAEGTRTVWEEQGKLKYRGFHSIRGAERVNGCYELARLETKQALSTELNSDIKGRIDLASQSISENAEIIVGKVVSDVFGNQVRGLRFTDEFFERYSVANAERIDCFVLSEISFMDYNILKRNVVERLLAIDPRIKEAVAKQQINFFSGDRESERAPQGFPIIENPPQDKTTKAPEPRVMKPTPAQPAKPSPEAVTTGELNED